jgi:hypothetical protein
LAEKLRAFIPKIKAESKFIIPLIKGSFEKNFFSEKKSNLSRFTTILPFGFRTAMAIELGDLIITPSITAWPPTRIRSSLFLGIDGWDREYPCSGPFLPKNI